jgi:alanyl-tRNA synthetase
MVWHTLASPLDNDEVTGVIDWERRFDHMQQHHGQHLLSAAFERLFQLPTVSFHLGATVSTIDLQGVGVDRVQLVAAEDLANRIIWEARPVLARFVPAEELAALALRKPPVVDGPVRVVSVPDFDHSACGGTHPRTTGAVGLLHVRRWERRGDTVRVEFLCGGRAAADYRSRDALVWRLAAVLSVGIDELEDAVERVRYAEVRARKQVEQAGERLIGYEARELVAGAAMTPAGPVVCGLLADRTLDDARILARAITEAGAVALLGVRAAKAQLVLARPDTHPADCNALLQAALAPFGGRGGGQPAFAQGGVPDPGRLEAALDHTYALVCGVESF